MHCFILLPLLAALANTSTIPRSILTHDSYSITTAGLPIPSSTTCTIPSSTPLPSLTPHVLNTFPKGTWLENLVIRQHDSNALVTLLSSPDVLLLSTDNSFPPQHIAHIASALGCLGIVELYHDVFYIVAGNWTAHTGISQPGTYTIWEIDMRAYIAPHFQHESSSTSRPASSNETTTSLWNAATPTAPGVKTRLIATLPYSGFLNGLTVLNPTRGILLAADSLYGFAWSISTLTGSVSIAINSTAMAPLPNSTLQLGINGLHVKGEYLYFDNTNKATLNRVKVDLKTGEKRGEVETLVKSDIETIFPDDFTVDWEGNVWMTADVWGQMDLLEGVAADSPFSSSSSSYPSSTTTGGEDDDVGDAEGELQIVAGTKGDEVITGWTAAKFGTRMEDVKRGSLYVTTNGGPVNYYFGNWTSGGMLVRLDAVELGVY